MIDCVKKWRRAAGNAGGRARIKGAVISKVEGKAVAGEGARVPSVGSSFKYFG